MSVDQAGVSRKNPRRHAENVQLHQEKSQTAADSDREPSWGGEIKRG